MEIAITPAMVAVKNFYIKANDSVMAHLDSVFFSIDLNTGVIFNQDSLPKGTNVSRLIPSITFANGMTKAELTFLKDKETVTIVNYLTNPEDSIDFSLPVRLDVTAADGLNSFTYQIKVNVHQQEPDDLIWNRMAQSPLPSRYANQPIAQKTVEQGNTVYSLIMEFDETYTLSSCNDLNEGNWVKKALDEGYYLDVATFTATEDAFYVLNFHGELLSSTDGLNWTETGQEWGNILGAYNNSVLGVRNNGVNFVHTQYPESPDFTETVIEDGFPLYNSSKLGIIETKWAEKPMAILACGMSMGGKISSEVWGYDGNSWIVLNDTNLPALEVPMLGRYIVYRDTPYVLKQRAFDVWILFGGTLEDGTMNRFVYISYDNGVNWTIAPEGMQFNNVVPSLGGADLIVQSYPLEADLSEAWTQTEMSYPETSTRGSYNIEGYDITWQCPYLYIFGGYLSDNTLSASIYRGVLARLKFTPSI